MRELPRPVRRWPAAAAALLLAAAAGFATYRGLRGSTPGLDGAVEAISGRPLVLRETETVELKLLAQAFEETWVASPAGPLPCPRGLSTVGPQQRGAVASALDSRSLEKKLELLAALHQRYSSSWLPGAALVGLLISEGRLSEAERELGELLRRSSVAEVVPAASGVVNSRNPEAGPSTEHVRAALYLLQAWGYVQLERNLERGDFWHAMKSPILCARLLGNRRELGSATRMQPYAFSILAPPGCPSSADDDTDPTKGGALTTHDLYNNLIVGYLQTASFTDPDSRDREFSREGQSDPVSQNPLQAVLEWGVANLVSEREHWVWAVSNTERVLRYALFDEGGFPANPFLSLNAGQLIESAITEPMPDPKVDRVLAEWSSRLAQRAWEGRERVAERRRQRFGPPLARLRLAAAIRAGSSQSLPDEEFPHLDPEQRAAEERLRWALELKEDPGGWLRRVAREPASVRARLGDLADRWLPAARADLVATLSGAALERDRPQMLQLAETIDRLRRVGDPQPPEREALLERLGPGWFLSPSRRWVAFTLALLAAWVTAAATGWLGLQWILRRELFLSFYRREIQHRLGSR